MTTDQAIKFEDGAAYERMMGVWSRIAGEVFLDWVKPAPGLRWLDVGCGNGAFTQLVVDRCAPAQVQGVDPAPAQIAYAAKRPAGSVAQFQVGDAQALPFEAARFDIATMALVIFFVPDPAKGVSEMARVLVPGGIACAYAWDITEGGFPLAVLQAEMRAMGIVIPMPPSVDAARLDVLPKLWREGGFTDVETRQITVERRFESFDELWDILLSGSSVGAKLRGLPPAECNTLRERFRARLTADAQGRITASARANAVKGRLPR